MIPTLGNMIDDYIKDRDNGMQNSIEYINDYKRKSKELTYSL